LITKEIADLCSKVIPFNPTIDVAQRILSQTRRGDRQPSLAGEYIYFSPGATGGYNNFQGGYNPMGGQGEGALRVRFLLCPTGPLSLVGQSKGGNPNASFAGFNIAQY
jgi:hypothetical protein